MGTRSLTIFKESSGEEICVMYRQYDGYPTGHGQALFELLEGFKIVNGYSATYKIANGIECLTAQVIAGFKEGCGDIYIHPAKTRDCGEAYTYIIYPENENGTGRVMLKCKNYNNKILYKGLLNNFNPEKAEEE